MPLTLISRPGRERVSKDILEDAAASHRASGADITIPDPSYLPGNAFALMNKNSDTGKVPVLENLDNTRVNRYVPSLEVIKNTPELRRAVLGKPRGLVLAMTEICDMSCRMCPFYGCDIPDEQKAYYQDYMRRRAGLGHASVKDFLGWADAFRPHLNMGAVSVYGPGEPFLHPDAVHIIQACNARGLAMNFSTNGNRLTSNHLGALKIAKILAINFSLDAFTPETHRKIKPNGDLSCILKNLNRLIEEKNQGVHISVSFIRQEHNAHEEQDFLAYWEKRVDSVVVTSKYHCGIPESAPSFTPHAVLPCLHLENSLHVLSNGDCWSCSAGAPDEFFLGNVDTLGPARVLLALDRYVETRINTGKAGPLCQKCRWWSQTQRIETWKGGKIIRIDQPFSYRVFNR